MQEQPIQHMLELDDGGHYNQKNGFIDKPRRAR